MRLHAERSWRNLDCTQSSMTFLSIIQATDSPKPATPSGDMS